MVVDPLSLAGLALTVSKIALGVYHKYERMQRVPPRLNNFKTVIQRFASDIDSFAKAVQQHRLYLDGLDDLKETLEHGRRILRKYDRALGTQGGLAAIWQAAIINESDLSDVQAMVQHHYVSLVFRFHVARFLDPAETEDEPPNQGLSPQADIDFNLSHVMEEHQIETSDSDSIHTKRDGPWKTTKPVSLSLKATGLDETYENLCRFKILDRDEKWRTLLWVNASRTVVFAHKVPRGTIPWTPTNDTKLLSFPRQEHEITITKARESRRYLADPLYRFEAEADRDDFQETVRERRLLATYKVESIYTNTRSILSLGQRWLASQQNVKIWRRHDRDRRPTISFLSQTGATNSSNPHHYEFHICDFLKDLKWNQGSTALKLRFPSRRRSSAKDKELAPPESPVLSGASSAQSRRDSLVLHPEPDIRPSPEDAQKVGIEYLELRFYSERDLLSFVTQCYNAHYLASRDSSASRQGSLSVESSIFPSSYSSNTSTRSGFTKELQVDSSNAIDTEKSLHLLNPASSTTFKVNFDEEVDPNDTAAGPSANDHNLQYAAVTQTHEDRSPSPFSSDPKDTALAEDHDEISQDHMENSIYHTPKEQTSDFHMEVSEAAITRNPWRDDELYSSE